MIYLLTNSSGDTTTISQLNILVQLIMLFVVIVCLLLLYLLDNEYKKAYKHKVIGDYCKFCGSKIVDDSVYCSSCGNKIIYERKSIKISAKVMLIVFLTLFFIYFIFIYLGLNNIK